MKKSLKKLRKHCETLTYQVQALELEQRIIELQSKATQTKPGFGFQGKAKHSEERQ